jgi:hypothetical protein
MFTFCFLRPPSRDPIIQNHSQVDFACSPVFSAGGHSSIAGSPAPPGGKDALGKLFGFVTTFGKR